MNDGYAADLSHIPDELTDRLGVRSLADAVMFLDQLSAAGCRARTRISIIRSDAIVEVLEKSWFSRKSG